MINLALLVLRVVVGLGLAAHGAQKLFGWFGGPGLAGFANGLGSMGVKPARPWALVAALAEFCGGILVAVGLLTPIAGLAACGSMLSAIFLVHLGKGFFAAKGGWELPLTMLAALFAISVAGPGVFSFDQILRVSLPEPITWYVTALVVLLGTGVAVATKKLPERLVVPKPRTA